MTLVEGGWTVSTSTLSTATIINDSCIQTGSDESQFTVSFTARGAESQRQQCLARQMSL